MSDEKFTVDVLQTSSGFNVCVMNEAGEVYEAASFETQDEAENYAWSRAVEYDCVYRMATPPNSDSGE